MSQEQWTAVDNYIAGLFLGADPVLEEALASSEAAGLPAISVSPTQGKLLHLLARMQSAQNILEIGTSADIAPFGWLGHCRRTDA